ncbi:MAG: DNA-binding protein [Polyangiaceae bacterium]|nr:DNA-binding protein [Polyangiaceae bacterium]
MNLLEARRARHLVVRLDRGEELPGALLRALDEAEARAGWIEGAGSLEAAEIAVVDQATRGYAKTRRIEGPCDAVSLTGNVALLQGEGSLRLWTTLARETDVGLQLAAGELVWARVYALELRITVFDDIALARVADDRTGLGLLVAQPLGAGAAPLAAAAAIASAEPARATPPAPPAAAEPSPALPPRPARPKQDEEQHYPEVDDLVTHFHFGECVVLSSDGERIRLRQERDGRVREVSLTMLRAEAPTTDPATGKRHFRLLRKN